MVESSKQSSSMSQKRTRPCSFLLFLKEWAAAANSTFPTAFTRPPRATKSSPPTSGKLLSLSCGLSPQREGNRRSLTVTIIFVAPAKRFRQVIQLYKFVGSSDGIRRTGIMSVRIVRLGTPRDPNEGLRVGTVRKPPRGVRKADYA